MNTMNICLLGFGNVGQALAELILNKDKMIREELGCSLAVVAIKTAHHGAVIDHDGIDLEEALKIIRAGGSLSAHSQSPAPEDPQAFLQVSGAALMAENTPVSYQDGQPALDHIRAALSLGMHVVTANKGPVVHAYQELMALSESSACSFYFEATVMDGAPIFSLWRETLPVAVLDSFRGVLNSTTNLILTRMESGESFESALKYAQSIGIAETDPSGDIEGWDAAIKVAALVTVLMGIPLKPQAIERTGIAEIQTDQVLAALKDGRRWKLICQAQREGTGVRASVKPELVDASDPLFSVLGTSSAVTFSSDVLGDLSVSETDPGPDTTAYGLLADILNLLPNRT